MTEKLKLVLMDDQNLCRRGLSELLSNQYGFNVLGATDSLADLRMLLDRQPDLLTLDLHMKPLDGISILNILRSEGYFTPAVILTMSDLAADLKNAVRVGVRGYLLKDMEPDDLADAIRRVAAGELVIAPAMTVKMMELLRDDRSEQEPQSSIKLLTVREKEILKLVSRGESNKEIAHVLSISYETVKQHVRNIMNKLNLSSRVKAAVLFSHEQNNI